MVGILRTNHAIILCALVTTEPVQSHVVSGLARELDALFVLLVIIRLARDYFKDVPALAFNQFWIIGRSNIQPSLLDLFPRLRSDYFFALPCRYLRVTSTTLCLIELKILSLLVYRAQHAVSQVAETRQVEHVVALARLEHANVTFFLLLLREGIHAELAGVDVFEELIASV